MSAGEVRLAMHGDADAFAALVRGATDRLYALACLILRDSDAAEDATQNAFVLAWRQLPSLRDADRFDAWLRRLVVNACYDEARRVRRRAEVSLVSITERSIADSASAMAETDRVERAFRRLPLDQRTVIALQHYLGLTQVEIAETLGIPLGTVKSRLRYGVTAMRAELDADDRSPGLADGSRHERSNRPRRRPDARPMDRRRRAGARSDQPPRGNVRQDDDHVPSSARAVAPDSDRPASEGGIRPPRLGGSHRHPRRCDCGGRSLRRWRPATPPRRHPEPDAGPPARRRARARRRRHLAHRQSR